MTTPSLFDLLDQPPPSLRDHRRMTAETRGGKA